MGHIHKYSMHCCKKTKHWFYLLLLLSSNYQVCCWTIIVHRLVSKTVFKNMCAAGMAMGLNMSLASLCSHINKSTYNDCKPPKYVPRPREIHCCLFQTAALVSYQQVVLQSAHQCVMMCSTGSKSMMRVLHCFYCKINAVKIATLILSGKSTLLQYLNCALFEEKKKKKEEKIKRCLLWVTCDVALLRQDASKNNQMRHKLLAVLWLSTEIAILHHVMRLLPEERHTDWNRDYEMLCHVKTFAMACHRSVKKC